MARIQISIDPSGRIIVSFPYDPLLVSNVKTIDGRRWHPAEKHWSFPGLDGILEKILKVFGDEDIQVGPALKGTFTDLLMSKTKNNERCTMNKKFMVHGSSFKVCSVDVGTGSEPCL